MIASDDLKEYRTWREDWDAEWTRQPGAYLRWCGEMDDDEEDLRACWLIVRIVLATVLSMVEVEAEI